MGGTLGLAGRRGVTPLLSSPRQRQRRVLIPIPLYRCHAMLSLPRDMTEQEAQKIAAVVLAYASCTSMLAKSNI